MEELFGSEPESGSEAAEAVKPAKSNRKRKSEADLKKPAQKKKQSKNDDADGMRRDPGSVLSAEREREMGRSKHKAVWSAVLAAGSGNTAVLSELIKATESAEDRDHLLNCLIQAPADSRAKMAACGMCLGALNSWLLELIAYGQTGSTAELTIKALQSFPYQPTAVSGSGLGQTVREKLLQGADKPLRVLVAALLKRWDSTTAGKVSNGAVMKAASVNGSGADRKAVSNDVSADFIEDEEPSPEILEADQAAERATAMALQYEEHAKMLDEQAAARRGSTALPHISAFGSSHRSKGQHSNGGSSSQRSAGRSDDSAGTLLDKETTAAVADYIGSLLKPMYRAQRLSKQDCKWVTQKATSKVAEHGRTGASGHNFMSSKRKLKIKELVDRYIKAKTSKS